MIDKFLLTHAASRKKTGNMKLWSFATASLLPGLAGFIYFQMTQLH